MGALIEKLLSDGTKVTSGTSAKKTELPLHKKLIKIEDLVPGGVTPDDAEKSKPHSDIFHAALKDLGDPPTSGTMTLGDSRYDAEAAVKVGLRPIGVLCGGF